MDLKYEISHLTLSEAIDELHNHYHGLTQGENEKARTWFLNHDATHVIFATEPFDIKGEMFNDVWTVFGSTVSLKEYSEFFKFSTAEKVFDSYGGKVKTLIAVVKLLPACIHVLIQTRKMSKKWPWNVTEELLQTKVECLRKEHNIQFV